MTATTIHHADRPDRPEDSGRTPTKAISPSVVRVSLLEPPVKPKSRGIAGIATALVAVLAIALLSGCVTTAPAERDPGLIYQLVYQSISTDSHRSFEAAARLTANAVPIAITSDRGALHASTHRLDLRFLVTREASEVVLMATLYDYSGSRLQSWELSRPLHVNESPSDAARQLLGQIYVELVRNHALTA